MKRKGDVSPREALACPKCGARGTREVWQVPSGSRLYRIRGCRARGDAFITDAFITTERAVPDGATKPAASAQGGRR